MALWPVEAFVNRIVSNMKRSVLFLGFLALGVLSTAFVHAPERIIKHNSFGLGEYVEYRVHYGFINAGESVVEVSPQVHRVNGHPCFRVNVTGRTTGAFDMVTRIRDVWRSDIDTSAIIPHQFYQKKQEGGYRREEQVTFDHDSHTAICQKLNDQKERYEKNVPMHVQDVISGFYFLRTIDYDKLQPGDVVGVKAFYDKELYDMRVKYRGKGTVKTKFGKIRAFKITPMMPKNKLFDGEESIRIWVSDDANKIPVKVEVDLFVGAIELDIRNYRNLKHEPKWL